ncbi:MAG: glycosyltransferase family 39 protein [Victivallales bacterium]
MHKNIVERIVFLSLLTFAFVFCLTCGRRGFFPLDQSIVFDGAWRIIQGQVPFRDFVCPIGPVSFLYQAELFCVFGVNFKSYLVGAALLNLLACAATFLIAKSIFPDKIIFPFAGALLSAIYFFAQKGTTYPDQMAIFLCLIGLLGFLYAIRDKSPGPPIDLSSCLLMFGSGFIWSTAFLTKQNFALFFLPLLFLLALIHFHKNRILLTKSLLFLSGGAAACMLIFASWLLIYSTPELFFRFFFEIPFYEGVRRIGGGSVFKNKVDMLNALAILSVAAFAICVLLAKRNNQGQPRLKILTASVITMYLAAYTFMMLKTTNNNTENGWSCIGIIVALGFGIFSFNAFSFSRKTMSVLYVLVSAIYFTILIKGVHTAWNREANYFRSNSIYEKFDDLESLDYLQWGTPTMVGRTGGKYVYIGKNEVTRLIAYLINSNSRFFIFTDFTALYAFTGKPSPQPLLWFHRGLTYSNTYDKNLDEWIVEDLKKNKTDTIIFEEASWFGSYHILKDFPVFNGYMQTNYESKGCIGNYNIYKLKTP